jgi:hypothetical protein
MGQRMQKSFERKTNLETLTKQIIRFFDAKKFEDITAFQNDDGYQIIAGNSRTYKLRSDLKVDIHKEKDGFTVNLEPLKETKRFNFPMTLATMFGGGYFLLKDLKCDEAWVKIEREFWNQVHSVIADTKDRDDSIGQHENEHHPPENSG